MVAIPLHHIPLYIGARDIHLVLMANIFQCLNRLAIQTSTIPERRTYRTRLASDTRSDASSFYHEG